MSDKLFNIIIFLWMLFALATCVVMSYKKYAENAIDMNKYIAKSQCIPLPSSDVHDYWACKKEVK